MCTDLKVISALLEGNTKDLLDLLFFRNIIRIDRNNIVRTLTLTAQDLQCFLSVTGSNYTVGNLSGNELSGSFVANIRQSNPVAERAHTISATGTGIRTGKKAVIQLRNIINKTGLLQAIGKNLANSSRSGADMLKGGNCTHTGCFL